MDYLFNYPVDANLLSRMIPTDNDLMAWISMSTFGGR
jgi:hypothetical protein